MFSSLTNQPQVKTQIVQCSDLFSQHFIDRKQVPNIGFAVLLVHKTVSIGIYWRKVTFPFFIFYVDRSFRGIHQAVSCITCGQNTIKHIYSQRDVF